MGVNVAFGVSEKWKYEIWHIRSLESATNKYNFQFSARFSYCKVELQGRRTPSAVLATTRYATVLPNRLVITVNLGVCHSIA